MFRQQLLFVMSVFLLLNSFYVRAVEFNVEFSADAIQIAPDRDPVNSKMFVSKSAVRTEMTKHGRFVIDIAYREEGRRLLIFPQQRQYMEKIGLTKSVSWSGKAAKTPCEGMQGSTCKKIGLEALHNVNVEKWQVTRSVNGKELRSLHWIDIDRRLAVKEMMPDGSVSELIMLGKGKLDGRDVEHWESHYSHSSGYSTTSKQWYDLELKIVIREEQNNGFIRELRNIKVGNQDRSLFMLPADYKKIMTDENSKKMISK